MSKRKNMVKRNYKAAVAAGLSVCLFGGGFVFLNNLVSAAAYDKPVEISADWQTVEAEESQAAGAGYQKADYKVEADQVLTCTNPNAISAEEAAELGAQYLWDVYGADLNGSTIHMSYYVYVSNMTGYWLGDIIPEGSNENWPKYTFSIEAVTGMRNSVERPYCGDEGRDVIMYQAEKIDALYKENSEFLELAKKYAEIQLSSESVKVEFHGSGAVPAEGYEYEMPKDAVLTVEPADKTVNDDMILIPWGEEIPSAHVEVCYLITDSNGNQVQVNLDVADKTLNSMSSIYNGVDYAPNGIG